ncbi:MAG: molybdopterin-dependent oxidoreductase [Pseudonocardiaceae bacterium]
MIRIRLVRLLAAGAVLVLTAFTGASAVASTSSLNQPHSLGLPAGKFLLIGAVARPQILSVDDLEAMPSRTIEVTFRSGSGAETHTYTGPLLFDVLTKAGPRFDPAIKNDKLRHFISFNASDNYRALVAWGEIDPNFENKDVLLATSEDGRSLAAEGPRLVVPGDIAGGRYVTAVVRVFLQKPPL